ncbi:hypothetical protein AB0D68_10825 [Streptomyces sp. NPDC048212]|uniref:hypothetical protein n=1 Tax=Streptomyces sp. NPDC048212 TaxID=3156658 RepID=UPI0033E82032
MSLTQRYQDDVQELTMRATAIAWHPCLLTRQALVTELFADCGTSAIVYADPAAVAALFVNHVSEAYAEAFNRQKEEAA